MACLQDPPAAGSVGKSLPEGGRTSAGLFLACDEFALWGQDSTACTPGWRHTSAPSDPPAPARAVQCLEASTQAAQTAPEGRRNNNSPGLLLDGRASCCLLVVATRAGSPSHRSSVSPGARRMARPLRTGPLSCWRAQVSGCRGQGGQLLLALLPAAALLLYALRALPALPLTKCHGSSFSLHSASPPTAAADSGALPSPLPLIAPPACRAMSNCTLRFGAIKLLLIQNAVYQNSLMPNADSLETLNAVRTLPQGSTRRKAPTPPQGAMATHATLNTPAARHPGNARHTQPLPARHPLSGCAWLSTHRLLARVPQTLPHPIGSCRRAANAQATHA
jgi:hypothetical protein